MKQELEQTLVRDFPNLFFDYNKDMTQTAMCWGCSHDDGWYNILREACEKLEPLVIKWIEENPTELDWKPRFSQVKEKYGTLSIYWTNATDEMYAITDEAEKKSETTCETCGKPGKLRGQGWIYCSCFNCAKEEDRDNLELVEDLYLKKEKKNG
jgi:hypothetical protein